MLDIQLCAASRGCGGIDRRDFIRVGAAGALGLTLSDWLQMQAQGETTPAKAKAVIQIWLGGGPPHTDTFDPKPEAGEDYCGPLKKPIETNVKGIRISELLPLLAKQADKYSIIRSMTHGDNGHETATYKMMTGTPPSPDLCYPSVGAVVAHAREQAGYQSNLPPYITLTQPLGRFSAEGFLGPNYRTFPSGGDPNAKEFRVQGLVPAPGMTESRMQERRSLVQSVDALARLKDKGAVLQSADAFQQKAYNLILGDAKKAFDLSQEKDDLRNKYGRHHFGQSCLMARRLVENGVPFVTVNFGGWDLHSKIFEGLGRLAPMLDSGFAALLEDLAKRGLLDSTIVACYGEFGRGPKIDWVPPWYGGRNHWGPVFSAVVAGGGFKAGNVVGASDARGEAVKQRPVYPWDLSASMYKLLGIDLGGKLPHPQGCTIHVSPLAGGKVPSGGVLQEIM